MSGPTVPSVSVQQHMKRSQNASGESVQPGRSTVNQEDSSNLVPSAHESTHNIEKLLAFVKDGADDAPAQSHSRVGDSLDLNVFGLETRRPRSAGMGRRQRQGPTIQPDGSVSGQGNLMVLARGAVPSRPNSAPGSMEASRKETIDGSHCRTDEDPQPGIAPEELMSQGGESTAMQAAAKPGIANQVLTRGLMLEGRAVPGGHVGTGAEGGPTLCTQPSSVMEEVVENPWGHIRPQGSHTQCQREEEHGWKLSVDFLPDFSTSKLDHANSEQDASRSGTSSVSIAASKESESGAYLPSFMSQPSAMRGVSRSGAEEGCSAGGSPGGPRRRSLGLNTAHDAVAEEQTSRAERMPPTNPEVLAHGMKEGSSPGTKQEQQVWTMYTCTVTCISAYSFRCCEVPFIPAIMLW